MDLDLKGKRALVCGSTRGIGRAIAVELALLGADITLLARNEASLRSTVSALPCQHDQRHEQGEKVERLLIVGLLGEALDVGADRADDLLAARVPVGTGGQQLRHGEAEVLDRFGVGAEPGLGVGLADQGVDVSRGRGVLLHRGTEQLMRLLDIHLPILGAAAGQRAKAGDLPEAH